MQLIDWSSSVHKLLDAFNDARDKHMCGLKDVDGKFVDSTFPRREGCMEPDAELEGVQVGKGTKQTSTRPRKFMKPPRGNTETAFLSKGSRFRVNSSCCIIYRCWGTE